MLEGPVIFITRLIGTREAENEKFHVSKIKSLMARWHGARFRHQTPANPPTKRWLLTDASIKC